MTTPTKETHRYVGMWRPPFEEAWQEAINHTLRGSVCRCGNPLWKANAVRCLPDRGIVLSCWLAGHFDESIYEPLAEAKQSESGGVVESFRRMPPIDVSQTFPVDEGAAKGKVIINERPLEDSD